MASTNYGDRKNRRWLSKQLQIEMNLLANLKLAKL